MSDVILFTRGVGREQEVFARLYSASGNGTYFQGKGRTVAEAIGRLVCSVGSEQLGLRFTIKADPDAEPQENNSVCTHLKR